MIVVGCGKSKLDRAAPARELYTGSLFRAARRYAEAREDRGDCMWAVLSAAHGLIAPGDIIRPYDRVLDLRGEELRRWARKAACQVDRARDEHPTGTLSWGPVELLAGARYVEPLVRELDVLGVPWRAPLDGLGMGARLAWLKHAAGRVSP